MILCLVLPSFSQISININLLIVCMEAKKIKMSLHRSHGDVEEIKTSYAPPNSDAQNASNIELLEYPSYDDFLQSSSAVTSTNLNRTNQFHRKTFMLKCGLALQTRLLTGGWESCWPSY